MEMCISDQHVKYVSGEDKIHTGLKKNENPTEKIGRRVQCTVEEMCSLRCRHEGRGNVLSNLSSDFKTPRRSVEQTKASTEQETAF